MRWRSRQAYVTPATSTSEWWQASSMSAVLVRVSCDGKYYLCGRTEAKEGGWAMAFQHQGSFYYCCDSCNTQTHKRREGLLTTFHHNPTQLWLPMAKLTKSDKGFNDQYTLNSVTIMLLFCLRLNLWVILQHLWASEKVSFNTAVICITQKTQTVHVMCHLLSSRVTHCTFISS